MKKGGVSMLVVIDESGCAGFKPASSSHFVLGMIIFKTFQDAEDTANIIHKLNKEIGFKREFRFSSCDNRKRDIFFETLKSARFKVRLFVVEKRLIHSADMRKNDELFINYCLKLMMTMRTTGDPIQDASIKIDGKGSRHFKNACISYLRKEMPPSAIKKLKFADSKNDVLIQLADMVVSAYSRPFNNPTKTDAFRWRNMLEGKIETVWNFK